MHVLGVRRVFVAYQADFLIPLVSAFASVAWIVFAPVTPDLGAQIFRTHVFAAHGFTLYDSQWYGGHMLPAYGVIFPALGALLGVRVVGAAATVASIVAFDRLIRPRFGAHAWRGTAWFGLALGMNLLSARLTFALGFAFGLGALLAADRSRDVLGPVLAAVCPLASPLAALFLIIAAVTWAVTERRARPASLALVAALPLLSLEVAFPEGGTFAFAASDFIPLLLVLTLGVALLRPAQRLLRLGFAAYAVVACVAYVLPSPVGSNATRLGLIACGPVLAAALSGRRATVLLLTSPALLVWSWAPTGNDLESAATGASDAAYYAPLNAFLKHHLHGPTRVEIPFTRGHWESVFVAGRVMLARGWERQLDRGTNPIFYTHPHRPLGAHAYLAWLRHQAVSYVALSDTPPDGSARAERSLILRRPSYLRQIWRSRDWRVFAVRHAPPLLSGPGTIIRTSGDSVLLNVRHTGHFVLRLHYSPYWQLPRASGCVGPAPGDWTSLVLNRAGVQQLSTGFALNRIAEHDARCA